MQLTKIKEKPLFQTTRRGRCFAGLALTFCFAIASTVAHASVVSYQLISPPVVESAGSADVILRITAEVDVADSCEISGFILSEQLTDQSSANAAEGSDYVALTQNVFETFASGIGSFQQDITIPLVVLGDTFVEPVNEQFGVNFVASEGGPLCFGEPGPADMSITSTIIDDDALEFAYSPATVSQAEDSEIVTVDLQLVNISDAPSFFFATIPTSAVSGTAVAGNDFDAIASDLNVEGFQQTSFSVTLIDDSIAEPDETFTIGNNTPASATDEFGFPVLIQVNNAVTVTITDDQTPDVIGLLNPVFTFAENAALVEIPVIRSGDLAGDASFSYTTNNGSAQAGSDYQANSGTLTFPAGDAGNQTITITFLNDSAHELPEDFSIVLSNPVNAVLGQGAATVNIADDDTDSLGFAATSQSIDEATGSVTVDVVRVGTAVDAVSVSYTTLSGTATAGEDFTNTTGTLSFPAGEFGPLSISVPITGDVTDELDETFDLLLSGPVGAATLATSTTTITIIDDDNPDTLDIASTTVAESATSVEVSVLRSGSLIGAVSVSYFSEDGSAASGDDYQVVSGNLNFPDGVAGPLSITVPLVNDALRELEENFSLSLSAPVNAELGVGVAVVTITDDDTDEVGFTLANQSADESSGSVTFDVVRTGTGLDAISVTYATAAGTADTDVDFTSTTGILNFGVGEFGPLTVEVPITEDSTDEPDETFDLVLSAPVGAVSLVTPTATVTILDNDDPLAPTTYQFGVVNIDALEGQGDVELQVTREGDLTASGSVDYSTQDGTAIAGSDFVAVSNTLTFAPGDAGPLLLAVAVTDDAEVESPEDFSVVLLNPVGGSVDLSANLATIAIEDNDIPPATPDELGFAAATQSVAESDENVTIEVVRVGSALEEISVAYTTTGITATADTDFTSLSGTLTFPAGEFGPLTISVPVTDDAIDEPDETFDLVLSSPVGPVTLTTSTVRVSIIDDDEAVTGPPPEGELVFPSGDLEISEDSGEVVISVSRLNGTVGQVSVDYSAIPGTATAGDDFVLAPGSLVWADGEGGERSFVLTIIDDGLVEDNETFSIELGNFAVAGSTPRTLLRRAGSSTPASSVTAPRRLGTPSTIVITLNDTGLAAAADSSISFVSDSVTVNESDGTVDIEVARSGAPVGIATIDWSTLADSAEEDGDFVAASGTLLWPDGDDTNKTISVELRSDIDIEGVEEFSIELSNPQGATVGDTPEAVVSISDVGRDLASVPGLSVEEQAFATALDNSCDGLIENGESNTADQQDLLFICGTVRNGLETPEDVREAIDALSGDELITAATSTLKLLGLQHNTFRNRLQGLRSGNTSSFDVSGLAVEIDGQFISGAVIEELFGALTGGAASGDDGAFGRLSFYVNGKLEFGEKDRDSANRGYDFDAQMFTVGADYRLNDNFFVGGAFGYELADVKFAQGGKLDVGGWKGSVYGSYFSGESFFIDAQASYGKDDYESRRRIRYDFVGGSIDRTAEGETTGDQFTAGIASGFDFNKGRLSFGPNAALSYFDVGVKSFSESGAGGLNLDIGQQQQQSLTLTAGAHASYVLNTPIGVLIPNARIDYIHEFMTAPEFSNVRFSADPFGNDPAAVTAPLNVQAETIDKNYMLWSVGTSAQFVRGLSGYVNFQSTEGYTGLKLQQVSYGFRFERAF